MKEGRFVAAGFDVTESIAGLRKKFFSVNVRSWKGLGFLGRICGECVRIEKSPSLEKGLKVRVDLGISRRPSRILFTSMKNFIYFTQLRVLQQHCAINQPA